MLRRSLIRTWLFMKAAGQSFSPELLDYCRVCLLLKAEEQNLGFPLRQSVLQVVSKRWRTK